MFQNFPPKKINSRYTILEAIIALTIIVVGVFSVMTLVVSSLNTTDASLDHLVAVNLAREGLEMVRNQRDTNWYQGEDFDNGLTGDATAVIDYDDDSFDFTPNNIDDAGCQLKINSGVYNHDTGADTGYYRLIYLNNICQDTDADPIVPGGETVKTSGADCDFGDEKIGIDIKSKVKYLHKGITQTIELNDRVYDWR